RDDDRPVSGRWGSMNRSRTGRYHPFLVQRYSDTDPGTWKSTDSRRSSDGSRLYRVNYASWLGDGRPTLIAITISSTAARIDPFVLREAQFTGIFGRGDNTCSSQVDDVECVHQKGICPCTSATLVKSSTETYNSIQGKQIMRFFEDTVPIVCSES